jgi:hypothetical protein
MQRFLKISKITVHTALVIIIILVTFNWEKVNRLHSVDTVSLSGIGVNA